MTPTALVLALTVAAPTVELQTDLWQVAPGTAPARWAPPDKPVANARALILVPGLHLHPIRPVRATRPELSPWQLPKSELVKALAKDFDVFAFAYSQTVAVDEVAKSAALRDTVAGLRKAGYREVVLVGHSAGGVIVRCFVEQFPDAGVARAVAVAAPFAGAEAANISVGVSKTQAPFVKSLAPEARKEAARRGPAVGDGVEFGCVVCRLKRLDSDGVVSLRSQWPDDLQQLGVPARLVAVNHVDAMDDPEGVKAICELAKGKLARWSADDVITARRVLFGDPPARPDVFRRVP